MPGAGKTVLAQQYAFTNGSDDEPAVYLTCERAFDKLIAYGQELAFFDPTKIGRGVRYHDAGAVLHDRGLPGLLELLDELLLAAHRGLLIIDSFKALHAFAEGDGPYPRFLHDLAGRLSAYAVTSLWLGLHPGRGRRRAGVRRCGRDPVARHQPPGRADGPPARGAQAARQPLRRRSARLSVVAHRPVGLSPPRRRPAARRRAEPAPRLSSGVSELDAMLDGGYRAGTSTLVAGPAGTGKTLLGLHFARAGGDAEPDLIASFQETAEQLRNTVAGLGWSWPTQVHVLHRVPVDLYVDEWIHELLATVRALGARRVVIDSLGDLQLAVPDDARFRELLFSLVHRLVRQRVTVLFTLEVPQLFGVTQLSEKAISHLSDNVLLLQYLRGESQLKRALTVLESRASRHEPYIRQYLIGAGGLRLGDPFRPDQDLA